MNTPSSQKQKPQQVGIALSGGGIRSATFNLGLLQRLAGMGILKKIDYLSTVSGGGYVGSWWTRFRTRHPEREFPELPDGELEPEEIRHLRQFSNFLSPRLGLFSIEFGRILVSVLATIIPALIVVNATFAAILLLFKSYFMSPIENLSTDLPFPPFIKNHFPLCIGLGLIILSICGATIHLIAARFASREKLPQPLTALIKLQHLLLMTGGFIVFLSTIWILADYINMKFWNAISTLGPALALSGLFGYIMKKISLRTTANSKLRDKLVKILLTPQILSYLIVILGLFTLASIMRIALHTQHISPLGLLTLLVLMTLLGLFLFDPRYFGMHYFYRRRLVRAYLGEPSLATEEQKTDDILLKNIELKNKPMHIICCAANDIQGDGLTTLNRGSCHTALSPEGVYVGCGKDGTQLDWNTYPQDISLGTALTASAAAFNSLMGFKSKQLGPAVTLVMTALNLRLGLWIQNPNCEQTKTLHKSSTLHRLGQAFPGWQFFAELLSLVKCIYQKHPNGPKPNRYLHLSDGAHFDNLGLYELIRRECRYVIVSDCGADPDYKFEDLGNAIRKIRTDFGVDIQLDVTPLCPNADGHSSQHVAVGSIRYGHGDRGVIIYIKPTLTGNEPEDILQYLGKHNSFPHESTGDQFYNEAQWESYRRLGFHTAHHIFQYASRSILTDRPPRLFNEALWHWTRLPEQTLTSLNELDARWTALRHGWLEKIPAKLCNELFPEIKDLQVNEEENSMNSENATEAIELLHDPQVLDCIISGLKFFEDLWRAANLDIHTHNPDLRGWMNVIQRWSRSQTTRSWWLIVRCLFSSRFVQFMEKTTSVDHLSQNLSLEMIDIVDETWENGLAARALHEFIPDFDPVKLKNEVTHAAIYRQSIGHQQTNCLQLGILLFHKTSSHGKDILSWKAEHFLIAPGLWGTGLGSRFIQDLISKSENETASFQVNYYAESTPDRNGVNVPRMPVKALHSLYLPHGFVSTGIDLKSNRHSLTRH